MLTSYGVLEFPGDICNDVTGQGTPGADVDDVIRPGDVMSSKT